MPDQPITTVHLIFKTHLDVGFTDLARNVVDRYFHEFIPQALSTARTMRERGQDRFIWTTGAWLIYEFLEQAELDQRRELENAITGGDIVWHGLPFTTHTELMDAGLFDYGLSLARTLDERFGRRTIAAKMTDVPGHTRAIVPLMADAGIQFLHLGVNEASTPPDVPPVFVWREPGGKEIVVLYQASGYGDLTVVPGLSDALAFAHTNDNIGPQSPEEATANFAAIRARFPDAQVIGSTLDAFAEKLLAIKDRLPVVTGEIGDTWIHGTGSDPKKISRFRELSRLRAEWLAREPWRAQDSSFQAFSRWLLMVPEHTWGMDEKTHLADYTSYAADLFRAARLQPNFRNFEMSWAEQRAYLDNAVAALNDTELAAVAHDRLAELAATHPNLDSFEQISLDSMQLESEHLAIRFDPQTGAINQFEDRRNQHQWADPAHTLGLFRYQTFSHEDYARFRRQYNVNKRKTAHWSIDDYTKPGMESAGAESRWWMPELKAAWRQTTAESDRLIAELVLPEAATRQYGGPGMIMLEFRLPQHEPVIYLSLQWFDKPACRLPEAFWCSFTPLINSLNGWSMEKLGQRISPLEVVRNGNRKLHAIDAGVEYRDAGGKIRFESLDAPLLAPGEPSLLNFNNRQPPVLQGMHFNLYNNIWGTNFPMWYEEDTKFRFAIRL